MSFANLQVPLESLPSFTSVEFLRLHPRYARVVLGVALAIQIPAFIFVSVLLFVVLVPKADLPLGAAMVIFSVIICALIFLAWFAHKSSSVIHYAIRQHDVIVRSGVFWRKETVQPISRIQHVEQHQGPIDKRFGLFELKLFSAGTGHFTFRIPGLDSGAASRIRQFILQVQQDGWDTESVDSLARATEQDRSASHELPSDPPDLTGESAVAGERPANVDARND